MIKFKKDKEITLGTARKMAAEYAKERGITQEQAQALLIQTGYFRLIASNRYAQSDKGKRALGKAHKAQVKKISKERKAAKKVAKKVEKPKVKKIDLPKAPSEVFRDQAVAA